MIVEQLYSASFFLVVLKNDLKYPGADGVQYEIGCIKCTQEEVNADIPIIMADGSVTMYYDEWQPVSTERRV